MIKLKRAGNSKCHGALLVILLQRSVVECYRLFCWESFAAYSPLTNWHFLLKKAI